MEIFSKNTFFDILDIFSMADIHAEKVQIFCKKC